MKNLIAISLTIVFIFLFVLIYSENEAPIDNNYNIIKLGQSCPLTGQMKELGLELTKGANAYFSHINAEGGIYGQTIKLISYDDKYEPDLAELNVQKLIEKEKVFALFNMVGTSSLNRVYPYISNYHVPILMPFSGADFLRHNPSLVFNLKKSYQDELENIIDYVTMQKHLYKFAVFYQNDNYGREGLEIAKQILAKKGLEFVAEGSYKRNTLSISHALKEITFTKPDAILMISSCKPSIEFIKQAIREDLSHTYFLTFSMVCLEKLTGEADYFTKNIIMSQTLPSPWDQSIPLIKEYQTLMHQYYPNSNLSFLSLEGFISAKIFAAALEQIGKKATRKKLMYALNHLSKDILDKYNLSSILDQNHQFKELNLINYKFNQINILQRTVL